MKRRTFLKNIAASSAGAVTLGGIPVRVMAGHKAMKMAAASSNNDNVLIFVQLHGGNDGLNTLIPIEQYARYNYERQNIAIPDEGSRKYINLDESVDVVEQVGLHPDMEKLQSLYLDGKAAVVKNVGYPQMNMSHFHGRDIMYLGLDGNDDDSDVSSGWMGRWLDSEYPNYPDGFPNDDMPDPVAIEMGNAMSIAFHRDDGIPIGLNIQNPQAFYDLINGVGIGGQFYKPEGHAGEELEYLWEFEGMSNEYAGRLRDVYNAGGSPSVEYPTEYPYLCPNNFRSNPLSGQLSLIARLLAGGIKTRIFLCRIGGFDTHAGQVNPSYKTEGAHAALLYHLFSGLKIFQDDLAARNVEDKVLTMTFSEFGRRVASNESLGTDHGTSMPVFVIGKGVKGGLLGENPDLDNLNNGNLVYTTDYRRIYASVIQDWFGATTEGMEASGFGEWSGNRLDLFGVLGVESHKNDKPAIKCFPNPADNHINFKFTIPVSGDTSLRIMNTAGQTVLIKTAENLHYGSQQISVDISALEPGTYIYQIQGKVPIGTGRFVKYK